MEFVGVVVALGQVEDQEVVLVILVQHRCNLVDVVAVGALDAIGRERHGYRTHRHVSATHLDVHAYTRAILCGCSIERARVDARTDDALGHVAEIEIEHAIDEAPLIGTHRAANQREQAIHDGDDGADAR